MNLYPQKMPLFLLRLFYILQLSPFIFMIFGNLNLDSVSFIYKILFFDLLVAEFILVYLCVVFLFSLAKPWRLCGYLILCFHALISVSQLTSYWISGEFITPLALQNITHIDLILSPLNMILIFFVCLGLIYALYRVDRNIREKKFFSLAGWRVGSLVVVAFCFYHSKYFISDDTNDRRYAIHREVGFRRTSPLLSFIDAMSNRNFGEEQRLPPSEITNDENNFLMRLGYRRILEQKYPLLRNNIKKLELGFDISNVAFQRKNVIVFFLEGISARTIGGYGGKYKDLTPNIDQFIERADTMKVINYYNHSAATYNGLLGSLCSFFPINALDYARYGNESKYYCLPNFFNNRNYDSYFFNGNRSDVAFVDDLARLLGFGEVLSADDLSKKFLNNERPSYRGRSLGDDQFFSSFQSFLKDRSLNGSKRPFFASLYNMGTHAFMDVIKGEKYYGSGKNSVLNRIHNLDKNFGLFWKYFSKSPFFENTTLIVTADHCSYYEKDFVDAFDAEDYNKEFVDKIPFLVFDFHRTMPNKLDAQFSSSIDFAPSLLHFLGAKNYENSFVGSSIFYQGGEQKVEGSFSSINLNYFFNDEGVYRNKAGNYNNKKLQLAEKYIRHLRILEKEHRIFPLSNQ